MRKNFYIRPTPRQSVRPSSPSGTVSSLSDFSARALLILFRDVTLTGRCAPIIVVFRDIVRPLHFPFFFLCADPVPRPWMVCYPKPRANALVLVVPELHRVRYDEMLLRRSPRVSMAWYYTLWGYTLAGYDLISICGSARARTG